MYLPESTAESFLMDMPEGHGGSRVEQEKGRSGRSNEMKNVKLFKNKRIYLHAFHPDFGKTV